MESTDRWSEHYAAAASYYGSAENYYRHHQQMYHNYPFTANYDFNANSGTNNNNNNNSGHNLSSTSVSSPPQWTRNNTASVSAYPTPNGSVYAPTHDTSPASFINPKLASSPLQINGNYSNIPYAYHQTYHGMHNFTPSSLTSCYNPLTPPKDNIGNKSTGETNSDSSTGENSFKNPKIESTEEEFDEDSSSNDLGDENWTHTSDNHDVNDDTNTNTKTLGLKFNSSTSKKTAPG
jgi:hypothetical protein